ncbi:C45 family autoproteolytic acyltransferase/hydolase [Litoreibacter halocynthiae]|uniref:C45 family autoproteolytic acyltransferase/hydolase n=1 Tax=Litoreibacter halocynthiae TaxID=1242689 RepID=UPI00249260E4|nr:C45 family peptidase [Litoreibacter halocynthiae]
MTHFLTFDAISEAKPGPKWTARWNRSWPAYEPWFVTNGGDLGPDRAACVAALKRYMPELVSVHDTLVKLAGGSDRAARFLSTWCPPNYLGGCSLACAVSHDDIRLVRNYDLSPDLNEGLLLRSEWTGRAVMGMVEFLWGVSDGINDAGLSVVLAYGGRQEVGRGFGITTILRYVLETCDTVEQALKVLQRVPSHMPYNVIVADASGAAANVEIYAGGGAKVQPRLVATNHQSNGSTPDNGHFTKTFQRSDHLNEVLSDTKVPSALVEQFTRGPLKQDRYREGFGTLFTAEYEPLHARMTLHWDNDVWHQTLAEFQEGQRTVTYDSTIATSTQQGIDWVQIGLDYAAGKAPDWRSFTTVWKDVA